MSDTPTTPAGWYPDPTAPGTERYWDGAAWTDHSRPVAGASPAPPTPPAPPAPPTPYSAPAGAPAGAPAAAAGPKPDNYLVWTILATVLCCLPIGAVGIYFSTQVDKLWGQGDVAGAERQARNARTMAIIAAVVSIVLIVGWVLFLVIFGEWTFEVSS